MSDPLTQATQPYVPTDTKTDETISVPRAPGPVQAPAVPGYDILDTLGRGGMGVVYRARNRQLDRIVALKMILAGGHAELADQQRLRTEAEAIARLQHPNIVQVFEVGEHQGLPFLSLEYCGGGNLARRLRVNPLEATEAAGIVEALGRAMQHAHEQGVLHRDLKPANILLTGDSAAPMAKVTDFGLARKTDEAGLTATGQALGTPSYMAPEQVRGTKNLGPACDIYALGAIIYECVTGRPPFKAATGLETVRQVVSDEPVSPRLLNPRVPRDLETICLKCLHKDPARRYSSAAALADDLRRFQAGEPILARPVGLPERAAKWVKRRPLVAALLAAVVLVTAAGAGAFAWAFGEAVDERNNTAKALFETEQARGTAVAAASFAKQEQAKAEFASNVAKQEKTNAENFAKVAKEKQEAAEKANRQTLIEKVLKERQLTRAEALLVAAQVNEAHLHLRANDLLQCRAALDETRWDQRGPEYGYVARQHAAKSRKLYGHTAPVYAVVLSVYGKRLYSCGWDTTIREWDPDTGAELRVLKGHKQSVDCLALTADGKRLFSGGKDGLKVWDLLSGKETATLTAGGTTALALSADGKRLFAGSPDGTITAWDADMGKDLLTLTGHQTTVTCLLPSPDGKRLYSGSEDRTARQWDLEAAKELRWLGSNIGGVKGLALGGKRLITAANSPEAAVRVWDPDTGKELPTAPGQTEGVQCLALLPDGKVVGGVQECIVEWDLTGGRETRRVRCHDGPVFCLAVTGDGQRIVTGGFDHVIQIFDAQDVARERPALTLAAHKNHAVVAVSVDGKRALTGGGADNDAKIWDLATGKVLHTLKGHTLGINCVLWDPDGRRAFTGSFDGKIKVWDAASGTELKTLPCKASVHCLAITADGKRLYLGGRDKGIRVWDLETGKETATLTGHSDGTTALVLGPHDNRLYSASWDKTVKVWDLETGKDVLTLRGHNASVMCLALCPDSNRLYSGGQDKTVRGWELATGQEQQILHSDCGFMSLAVTADGKRLFAGGYFQPTIELWDLVVSRRLLLLPGHPKMVATVVLTADARRLYSAGGDGAVKAWDLAPPREPRTLHGHVEPVGCVAVTADNTRLCSASWDGKIKVWDLETGKELHTLRGHDGKVSALALSADGKRLYSAGKDRLIRVWDLGKGEELPPLAGHTDHVTCLALSPDGKRLYSGSWDKTIREWDLDSGDTPQTVGTADTPINRLALTADGKRLIWFTLRGLKARDLDSGAETLAIPLPTGISAIAVSRDRKWLFTAEQADEPAVTVWNLETGQAVHRLKGHVNWVTELAVSPDGKRLFSSGFDETVRMWDVATGKELARLHAHGGPVHCLTLSVDGRRLYTGGHDYKVRVWDVEAEVSRDAKR
jgi:WD40 repeat protein